MYVCMYVYSHKKHIPICNRIYKTDFLRVCRHVSPHIAYIDIFIHAYTHQVQAHTHTHVSIYTHHVHTYRRTSHMHISLTSINNTYIPKNIYTHTRFYKSSASFEASSTHVSITVYTPISTYHIHTPIPTYIHIHNTHKFAQVFRQLRNIVFNVSDTNFFMSVGLQVTAHTGD